MPVSMRAFVAIDSVCRLGFWGLQKTTLAPFCQFGYNFVHDTCAQTYLKVTHPGYAKVCNGLALPLKLASGRWFGEAVWRWASTKSFTKSLREHMIWPIHQCTRKFGLTPIIRQHLLGYYVEKQVKKTTVYKITSWVGGLFGKNLDSTLTKQIDLVSKIIVDSIDDRYLKTLSKQVALSVYSGIAGFGFSYLCGRFVNLDLIRWMDALGPKTIQAILEGTHTLLPDRIVTLPGIKSVVEDLRQKEALDQMVDKIQTMVVEKTGFTVAQHLQTVMPEGLDQKEIHKILAEIAIYLVSSKLIKGKSL